MCGRYALHASEQEIIAHFQLKRGFAMKPRFNIAPTQIIPVILEWQKQMDFGQWGFIAPWVKSMDGRLPKGHINARLETIHEKPSFKTAIHQQRCLIPASGYYEWRQFGAKKQPYYVVVKQKPLIAFAGIWSIWQAPGQEIRTCAILTRPANQTLSTLHERMPLILSPENYRNWLAKGFVFKDLANILACPYSEKIEIKPVSMSVNRTQFEGEECIRSLS